MRFQTVLLGTVLLFTIFDQIDANKICFQSKTCIHNSKEKCGVNKQGEVRRFLDSCDMLEFNCLKKTDYEKTSPQKCDSLPAIDDQEDTQITNDAPPPSSDHENDENPNQEEEFSDHENNDKKLSNEESASDHQVIETDNIEINEEDGSEENENQEGSSDHQDNGSDKKELNDEDGSNDNQNQ